MLVDSHSHLDFPELADRLSDVLQRMSEAGVGAALCPGVTLERFPAVLDIVRRQPNLWAAVGVHPDTREGLEPTVETLVGLAQDPKVVAVGETGLDYYRLEGDLEWQRKRFRVHIQAARELRKPLIIHCRAAAADTVRLLREESAGEAGGVFHCFTESLDIARQALDLGFLISFSGIVTFKNAEELRTVAGFVPLDRILIETDAPYLAPTPHRGKINEPAYVALVAQELARVRGMTVDALAAATTENFYRLFRGASPCNG
jgi:TatD DNase family protein